MISKRQSQHADDEDRTRTQANHSRERSPLPLLFSCNTIYSFFRLFFILLRRIFNHSSSQPSVNPKFKRAPSRSFTHLADLKAIPPSRSTSDFVSNAEYFSFLTSGNQHTLLILQANYIFFA